MNLNINYYGILGVSNDTDVDKIKKAYYKLSKKLHPDVNPNPLAKDSLYDILFQDVSEAWSVLSDENLKDEYDKKSKFGKDYNELEEFFKINLEYNHKEAESNYDKIKKEVLDILIKIDSETFNGELEFPRYVACKTCQGTGKDQSTKFSIKGPDGKIKWFEGDDGCDFCEGSGKSWNGQDCSYCGGQGKVGINPCKVCSSEGRILGKQKLKDIKLSGDETKIESMGHWKSGRVGNLIIKVK